MASPKGGYILFATKRPPSPGYSGVRTGAGSQPDARVAPFISWSIKPSNSPYKKQISEYEYDESTNSPSFLPSSCPEHTDAQSNHAVRATACLPVIAAMAAMGKLPPRSTRGLRMSALLDDQDDADEEFWGQDAFKEEEEDVEYESEAEEADVFDSDFNDSESSEAGAYIRSPFSST